jgi:DNA topoisomerase-6 subunit A
MRKKQTRISALERKKEVLTNLSNFGNTLYNQMDSGTFPWVKMPSRSIENIYYNPEVRQYVLGEKNVRRSTRNIRHIRPFTQLVWAAYFADQLSQQRKTSTLRDVYYSAQAYDMSFTDQAESNNVITDLETVTNFAREDFNVFPEERSAIFGDLTIEYTVPGYEGKRLNLTSHPDGVLIGPALTSSEFVKTSADKVIAIEKGGLFTRFIEEEVHKKYNSLLVLTAGQAPRATRQFIRRLSKELDLPVYVFTDGDPWGMHIAMVIISGSANAAHLRELTTPDAKWSGVWATDIADYKLPSDSLTEIDVKRLYELQKDPRYEGALWQREIKTFLKNRKKAEQEAFSRYGLTYIVDEYLPAKLEAS